jgi:serine/threonine-protein kinase
MHIQEPLPGFPPEVPERLQEIVRVATAKDPAARFQTADALAVALRDEGAGTATVLLPRPAEATAVTAPVGRPDPSGASGAPSRRRRPPVALLVVAAVLLLLGGGWLVASNHGDGTAAERPTGGASSESGQVRVRPAAYVGLPRAVAARRLRERGLRVVFDTRRNPGAERAGTVAAVSPRGLVDPGSPVTLTVWGAAPVVAPTPAPAPSTPKAHHGAPQGKGDKGGHHGGKGAAKKSGHKGGKR